MMIMQDYRQGNSRIRPRATNGVREEAGIVGKTAEPRQARPEQSMTEFEVMAYRGPTAHTTVMSYQVSCTPESKPHPPVAKEPTMEREQCWHIVCENVQEVGLRRHMLAVEAAMKHYAGLLKEDLQSWGRVGLLHDFDWEIHPQLPDHPTKGSAILRQRGLDEEDIRTILTHCDEFLPDCPRRTPRDFALLACDEITGLISAVTLVRPSKNIADVKIKSIKKKWKDKSFAAGVDRRQIEQAVADFSGQCFDGQLDLWQHAEHVLQAMQTIAADLQLDGQLAS
jgi:predicted hydrolase (HD superfamily)